MYVSTHQVPWYEDRATQVMAIMVMVMERERERENGRELGRDRDALERACVRNSRKSIFSIRLG